MTVKISLLKFYVQKLCCVKFLIRIILDSETS